MFARLLLPAALSSALLLFGPTAQGDLELDVPDAANEARPLVAHVELDTTAPMDALTESLLVSRLATLDRDIPGLPRR